MTEVKERRLRRWVEGASQQPIDTRIGALFARVEPVRPLDASQLAAVRMRLERQGPSRAPWLLRHALLLGVGLLLGTGFALANFGVQRWLAPAPTQSAEPPPLASVSALAAQRAPSRSGVGTSVALPVPVLLPTESSARPRWSSDSASSRLGRESELLTRALTRLRADGDAVGALGLLEQYRREFPAGALQLESDIARLDAFIALGRHAEALALLDRLPIDRIGRGPELWVVRAELRARGNAASAVRDFDAALAVALPPALHERALFGRGASRLRSGDAPAARADFSEYLRRYPNGRFAAEARAQTGAP